MGINAFIYEAESEKIKEEIDWAVIKGKLVHLLKFQTGSPYTKSIKPEFNDDHGTYKSLRQVSFGKNIEMPVGALNADVLDGTKTIEYMVAVIVDSPVTHRKGQRETTQESLYQEFETDKKGLQFIGIYSGDTDRLVTDFHNTPKIKNVSVL